MASSEPKEAPPAAFVYEVDEKGIPISGSKRSAKKKEDKEKPKPRVSHRDEKKHSKSDSGIEAGYPMMSGARQDEDMSAREVKVERRRSNAGSSSKSRRYSTTQATTSPSKSKAAGSKADQASYFGIPAQTAAVPTLIAQPMPYRPHLITAQSYPARPLSYHAAYQTGAHSSGPPVSNPAFWQHQVPAPSYPPPAPSSLYMQSASSASDYLPSASPLTPRALSRRFELPRTGSGYGFRDPIRDPVIQQQMQDAYDEGYTSTAEASRRPTIRMPINRIMPRSKAELDYEAMPPPQRPASARPVPGPSILRRPNEYPVDVSIAPELQYRERDSSRTLYREDRTPRRQSLNRNSSYNYGDRRVEAANSGRRRQSYYGESALTGLGASDPSGWEDKAAQAASYQDDVSGSALPLTADMLRRQERRQGGSSRSTKSSGSRDESDYRRSATTRTTRSVSSPEDENVTIKVTGQARVVVGGTQIDCDEGGEIEIKRQKSLKNGSEWSNSEYGDPRRVDDRRSRVDKPAGGRSRRSSSYVRSSPQYPPVGNFI